MNFFNRAIKNVTRKLSKTILLVLTFFVIGNFVIIGLSVSNAAESAKLLTRQKMRAVVTVSVDYNKAWQYADQIEDEDELAEFYKHYPTVKLEDVNSLLTDERVKTANATSVNMMYFPTGSSIDFVHLNNQAEQNLDNNGQSCWFDEITGEQNCSTYIEPKVATKANYFANMIEFEDGQFEIVDGRFYTDEEIKNGSLVCVVTEEFAEYNHLSVGDKVALLTRQPGDFWGGFTYTEDEITMNLEIIGIYSHTNHIMPDSNSYDYTYPYDNPDNLILIPGNTLEISQLDFQLRQWDYFKEIYPDDEYYSSDEYKPSIETLTNVSLGDTTLLLSDPLEVDNFVKEHKDDLGQFIKIDANNEEFNRLAKPLDTLNLYSNFIVWLVVINAIVIITLVTALTLKTREYEIGVLLSIGASKMKVIGQFFIELALVAVIGFTLAVGSGSLIANKVGQTVLDYQINESGVNENEDDYYWQNDYVSIWNTDYSTKIELDDLIAEYDASVSPLIIGEIYVMGLGIVLISVLIPSVMIMRYNPKKILMGMN